MEYIYSALLLHKTGQQINEANVKKVLETAGAKVDETKVKALVSSLENVNIEEVIKEATVVPVVSQAVEAKVEKKEEKKEERVSEETAAAGLGSLFG